MRDQPFPREISWGDEPFLTIPQMGLLWGARLLALASVLITPWFLGGVYASAQLGFAAAGSLATFLALIVRPGDARLPWAALPLLAGIALGAFQLLPLPIAWIQQVAPASAQWREDLGQLSDNSDADASRTAPVSLAPAETRRDLALLISATNLFCLGGWLFRGRTAQRQLLWSLALNGTALGFFGIVQQLTWNGSLFWSIPLTRGGAPFASYVNKNNAAGYLLITLGAAIGLLVEYWPRPVRSPQLPHSRMPLRSETLIENLVGFLNGSWITCMAMVMTIVTALFCSLSRGGVLAMLIGAAITGFIVLGRRGSLRGLLLTFVLVSTCGGLVAWLGLSDSVQSRLSTLWERPVTQEGRLPHWNVALTAAKDHLATGSGLGTYRFAYRPHQTYVVAVRFYHAENQFVESLLVAGLPGLLLLIAEIGLMAMVIWKLLKGGLETLGIGTATLFALSSQIVHGSVDFGLYFPANAGALALLFGTAASQAMLRRPTEGTRFQSHGTLRRSLLVGVMLLIGGIWSCGELQKAMACEDAQQMAKRVLLQDPVSLADLEQALRECEAAVSKRPDDAETHRTLAQLWVRRYQTQLEQRLREQSASPLASSALRPYTSLAFLHGQIRQLQILQRPDQLQKLREDPVIHNNLLPAIQHLEQAREASPLLASCHLDLAELTGVADDIDEHSRHLERAQRRNPHDEETTFRGGLAWLQAGNPEEAMRCWRETFLIAPQHRAGIIAAARGKLTPEQFAEGVLPADPEALLDAAERYFRQPVDVLWRRAIGIRVAELLPSCPNGDSRCARFRGQAALYREDYRLAVECFEQAVRSQPQNDELRYLLAVSLQKSGRRVEAGAHARAALNLKPTIRKYQSLNKELESLSGP